ncbi:MAG TPA: N-acetylmuramoyl-L-alanine amidase [Candidatus Omnitrophota bacterium]|nr:N-acetylmuramoyl-L-alanine amidase [Candidatus Omnitrophota bacterium]
MPRSFTRETIKKSAFCAVLLCAVSVLSSCRTTQSRPANYYNYQCSYGPSYRAPAIEYSNVQLAPGAMGTSGQNIFHVVAPGETVWRLGKMYNVNPDDIMRANNLRTPQELATGQKIVIPGAGTSAPRPVISLYPSDNWKYIIIHHSATDEGNALDFNKAHNVRGFQGIGYHFVIDNGTKGKSDGQIEVSPRWTKQQKGAHCLASGMNHRGIGICLVGNFSQDSVSEKQMDSLVYLVGTLKSYYKIPDRNIMGHGQVYGARTECPGKYFSWRKFFQRLDDSAVR